MTPPSVSQHSNGLQRHGDVRWIEGPIAVGTYVIEDVRALVAENARLRTALLTISAANDPAAPIDRATCAALATAALTGTHHG